MANFDSIKSKTAKDAKPKQKESPPRMDEARHNNLLASETAPLAIPAVSDGGRIDGRSLRRSGRTVQFATRVSPDFDREVREIAQREGIMIVEVLERCLATYRKQLASS